MKINTSSDHFLIKKSDFKDLFNIMKICLFLLFAFAFQLMATNTNAQDAIIELRSNSVTVSQLISEIEKQTDYLVVYSNREVNTSRTVNLKNRSDKVSEYLNESFAGTDVRYDFDRNYIVLSTKIRQTESILSGLMGSAEQQQGRTLRGTVKDMNGEPIIGVTVVVRGNPSQGTVTDIDGNFVLTNLADDAVLQVTYVGMVQQDINTLGLSSVNITLEDDTELLEEIVVIGYGTARKSDLTGSVGSVTGNTLSQRPAINVEQSLSGKIAGVQVQENSGRPGGNTKISIRGYSSFNASNEPLYVVDGIVWPQGIGSLNMNDIETIDVLKDASSTAIYGTRGSNGVIMITTKRGTDSGVAKISYNGYLSVNWLPADRKLDALNSKEFMFIEEEQYNNAPKYDPEGFAKGKYTDPIEKRKKYVVGNTFGNRELFTLDSQGIPQPIYDINWEEMSTRTTLSQGHHLSYVGGDKQTNYGLFLGYNEDNGIIKRSASERYNMRAVLDRQMKDWLKVGGTMSYVRKIDTGINDASSYDVLRYMVEHVPFIPYKYEDGTYGYSGDYQGLEVQDSPLTIINEKTRQYTTNLFNGTTYLTADIIKGLNFTSTFGVNLNNYIDRDFASSKLRTKRNDVSIRSNESLFWQWSNRFNYNTQIGNKHFLDFLAGFEMQSYDYFSWTERTRDMADDYFLWYNMGAGATPSAPTSNSTDYRMESYFSRLNYNYAHKYLLTLTGRFDGSSRFGADNKFSFFPSAAFAWRVSEEEFLKDVEQLSNLKLRMSYGLTGNSEIGSYRSLANMSTTSYVFNGQRITGAAIGRLANPLLQWEKTAEYNLGFDVGFFNNRLSLSGDYYVKKTHDLLFDAPVPATSGYTTVTRNIGSIENKGVEFAFNSVNVQNKDFTWMTTFNLATLKNKVLALGANNEDIKYGFKEALILRVGESAGSIFGYERAGIWGTAQEAEAAKYGKLPGDLRIVDQNNDGLINNEDRVIIGKGIPDFYGTLLNSFQYKAFDLILELQFSQGNDIFNNHRNSAEARQGIANSFSTVLDAWTPDNQDAVLEQVRPTGAYYHYYMDTRKLENGSFLRGKNLSLGYTFSPAVNKKLGISNLRIYSSFQNFFILTEYSGYDPEVSNYHDDAPVSLGMAYSGYPKPRTYLFGLEISF